MIDLQHIVQFFLFSPKNTVYNDFILFHTLRFAAIDVGFLFIFMVENMFASIKFKLGVHNCNSNVSSVARNQIVLVYWNRK